MTYASGGLIEASDYNNFVTSVNAIWGTGSSDSGYGQATTLSNVSPAGSITATQWINLIDRIDSMRAHQSGVSSGLTSPIAGDVIAYLSTLNSQLSSINTNRLSNTGSGFAADSLGGVKTLSNSSGFTTTRTQEFSITFLSHNQMRYFFNTGGFVSIAATNSALTGNTKSTNFQSLCDAFGTTRIYAQLSEKSGGSGTLSTSNTAFGFYDLDTTDQLIFRQYSTTTTGGYNSNYISSFARVNSNTVPTVIRLKIVLQDDAADGIDDTVSGTVRTDCTARASGVAYVANVWGSQTSAVVTDT